MATQEIIDVKIGAVDLIDAVDDSSERRDDLEFFAMTWPDKAASIVVENEDDFETATRWRKAIKALIKEAGTIFDPIVNQAHKTHKLACAGRNAVTKPLKEADGLIQATMDAWRNEQVRKAEAERRKLEAEARAQAEEERRAAEAALKAAGREDEAEAVAAQPIEPYIPPVAASAPKVEGLSYRTTWDVEVFDIVALARHVAKNPEDSYLIEPNLAVLRSRARTQKSAMNVPGVRAVSTTSSHTRS